MTASQPFRAASLTLGLALIAACAAVGAETVLSPAGTATMEIRPTGGDFHRIFADLRIVTSGGGETLLEGIEGSAFLISDVGRIVVLTTDHPRHIVHVKV